MPAPTPPLIPADLHAAVFALSFENPSDGRLARHALAHPERATPATLQWLAALVARRGARYDDHNPAHAGPHYWPPRPQQQALPFTPAQPAAATTSWHGPACAGVCVAATAPDTQEAHAHAA